MLYDGGQIDVIFTDFQKAFDQINHNILLAKLRLFSFSDSLVSLLKSYLEDRRFMVRYQNFTSRPFSPTSGVPQGSNLGPLLFLLFINDLSDVVSCEKLQFADDFELYSTINSIDCDRLQMNLNNISLWCDLNQLSLNMSKCKSMSFTRKINFIAHNYCVNDYTIDRVESFKDLGITFDSKLTFVEHINNIVSSAFRTYGFIYRNCRDFSDERTFKTLFCSLVRSKIEYGSIIWYPIYGVHSQRLESVQRRFLKFVAYRQDGFYPPIGINHVELLNRFNMQALQVRRNVSLIRFLYNLLNNKIDCSILLAKIKFRISRGNSRQQALFYCDTPRTNILTKSPINLMCGLYNKIGNSCDILSDSMNIICSFVCHL